MKPRQLINKIISIIIIIMLGLTIVTVSTNDNSISAALAKNTKILSVGYNMTSNATHDGYIVSSNITDYSAALAGMGFTVSTSGQTTRVGQNWAAGPGYTVYRGYLSFNTSSIPTNDTIISAKLYVKTQNDVSNQDFNCEVYNVEYDDSLSSADWNVSGEYEGILLNTTTMTLDTWYSIDLNISRINKSGFTQYQLKTDQEGTTPTDVGTIYLYVSDYPGTSNDPYLVVQHGNLRDPIRINNNADFNATNGINSGNGSIEAPYIIDNWLINGTGDGIYIGNTTSHFIIRNNTMLNNTEGNYNIHLTNVTNGTVQNNTCYANSPSVVIYDSTNVNVSDNVLHDGGVEFKNVSNSIIWNNTIIEPYYGVHLLTYASEANSNVTISYNNITNSYCGMMIKQNATLLNITNNIINHETPSYGIYLYSVEGTINYTNILSNDIYNATYGVVMSRYTSGTINNISISLNSIHNVTNDCIKVLGQPGYNYLYMQITNNSLVSCYNAINFANVGLGYCDISQNNIIDIYQTGIISVGTTYLNILNNNFIDIDYALVNLVSSSTITMDRGYQYGGNYFSALTTPDDYHGEYQDITGGDNIRDTPIPGASSIPRDNYPLIQPFGTNITPLSDAGYDQIGYGGFRRLYGNESSDAGGSSLNWTWWFVYNGTPYTFYGERVNFTFDKIGEYNITLNVTDSDNNVESDYSIVNITSIPEFFDDGIYSTAWTSYTPNNTILDTTFDRHTVHHLNVSVSSQAALITNTTVNISVNESIVLDWIQYMTLDDNDHINITVDNGTKLNTIEIYENKANINGQEFATDTKEDEWASWRAIVANNGAKTYLFVNGSPIGNQTSPYAGSANNLSFSLTEVGSSSSSEWYIDQIALYNYSAPVAEAGPYYTGYKGKHSFDGSGSTGVINNYTWNFTFNSTPITLYGVDPVFNFTISGNYTITLNVTDYIVYSTDITYVNLTNQIAVADAGANQTYGRGIRSLDGSGSYDPDGPIANYTWNFTDSGTILLYGVSPSYNFTTLGTYNITLNITDDEGAHSWDNVTFTIINALPIADAGPDQMGKRTKTFDGSGSYDQDWGTIDNYTWNFTYNAAPVILYGVGPSFDFNITGNYLVMLNVTDNDGGTDEDVMWMNITITPPVSDAGPDDSAYKGTYNFDGSGSTDSDGSIINYTWNFTYNGSPAYMYGSTPSYNFQILGFYNVTLNVTDDDYRYDEDIMMLQIVPQFPIANAGLNQTGKRILSLDGSSSTDPDGTIVNYTWNFTYGGSPIYLYGVNPSFDFNISGVYIIMLNVTDDDGLNGYDNVTITVTIQPPNAVALHSPGGTLKGTRHVVGTSSSDPDGLIINYTWNFTYNGNPVYRYTSHFWYTFNLEGVYVITLNVTDDDYRYDTDTTTITIIHLYPVADATFTVDDTNKGVKTFDGSGSYDSDGSISNYTWNFTYDGNPKTLYGVSSQFNFSIAGSYVVMLNVTDNDGHSSYDNVTVIITLKAPVASAGNNRNVTKWNVIVFNGLGSSDEDGYIVNYTWNLTYGGVNYTLYGVTPEFWVNQTENFTATLTITDDDGLQGFDNVTFYVVDPMVETYNWLVLMIPLVIIMLVVVLILRFFRNEEVLV